MTRSGQRRHRYHKKQDSYATNAFLAFVNSYYYKLLHIGNYHIFLK